MNEPILYSSLFQLPDTFSFMAAQAMQFQVSKDSYEKQLKIGKEDNFNFTTKYWDMVDDSRKTWAEQIASSKNQNSLSTFTKTDDYIAQVWENRKAWENMFDVMENGGHILSFDTETIGGFDKIDANDPRRIAAGITEIGFDTRTFKGSNARSLGTTPKASFFFGIDETQRNYLLDLVKRYEKDPSMLSGGELSDLERASRHSTIPVDGHVFSVHHEEWKGMQHTFVDSLNVSRPNDVAAMMSGIENMYSLNTANREQQMSHVIEHLNDFMSGKIAKGQNRATVGQNLQYDINFINNYADAHGTTEIKMNQDGYVDTMQGLKARAAYENRTEGSILKEIYPELESKRLGSEEAIVEAIRGSTEFTEDMAHSAYNDAHMLQMIIAYKDLQWKKVQDIINDVGNDQPNMYKLKDSYVKINKKGLNRGTDIMTINGVISTGYNPSNMYWEYAGDYTVPLAKIVTKDKNGNDIILNTDSEIANAERTGRKISSNPNDKYILKLKAANDSYNDEEKILLKVFDTEKERADFLSRYTSLIDKSKAHVGTQEMIHDLDIARRVIDGFFDTGNITQSNKSLNGLEVNASGGFASFKKYYDVYKQLSSLSDETVTAMGLTNILGEQITDANDLINNIGRYNNLEKIVDYSKQNNLNAVTDFFYTSERKQRFNAQEIVAKNYREKAVMQETFGIFNNNQAFFEYANEQLSSFNATNLQKTVALQKMKETYESGLTPNEIVPMIADDDIYKIGVKFGDKASQTLVDISDVNRGAASLQSAARTAKASEKQISDNLHIIAKDLANRDLITRKDLREITKMYGGAEQSYGFAKEIAQRLHNNMQSVLQLDTMQIRSIVNLNSDDFSVSEIADEMGLTTKMVNQVLNKNYSWLQESVSTSMSRISHQGPLSQDFIDESQKFVEQAKRNLVSFSGFDMPNEEEYQKNISSIMSSKYLSDEEKQIRLEALQRNKEAQQAMVSNINKTLSDMGYTAKEIDEFNAVFYENGKSKFAATQKRLGDNKVSTLFFKSGKEEGSAFMVFTNQNDYAKTHDALSRLEFGASNKEIKEALQGKAAYYEIHNLKRIDLDIGSEADKVVRDLTTQTYTNGNKTKVYQGHGGQAVLVKQGENYLRYDTLSLNIYEDSSGKIYGGIRDQGGKFLTNIRRTSSYAAEQVANRNYDSATYTLNKMNIAEMAESSAPQFNGVMINGELRKVHLPSAKDFSNAYQINLGKEDFYDYLSTITTKGHGVIDDKESYQALVSIYDMFSDKYNKDIRINGHKSLTLNNAKRVFGDSNFRIFSTRYMSWQTKLGTEGIVQDYIRTNEKNLSQARALAKYKNKSLMNIIADVSTDLAEAKLVDENLANTFQKLAGDKVLNAAVSQAMSKHGIYYLGDYDPYENVNGKWTAIIRPTHTQRDNYRPFQLTKDNFTNIADMEKRLGIHFGDLYASTNFVHRSLLDNAQYFKKSIEELTEDEIAHRSIVGAVQSISDTEIQQRFKSLNIEKIAQENGLDSKVLGNIAKKMQLDLNTYEGKAYMRPELANQPFFTHMDPKTIKVDKFVHLDDKGKSATEKQLKKLVGSEVKAGDIIGYSSQYNKRTGRDELKAIKYTGPTIDNFTQENADELLNSGKTSAVVSKQIEDIKVMWGDEKGTVESLIYTRSIRPEEQLKDIQTLMSTFEFNDNAISTSLDQNVRMLNQYTNTIYDALTPNSSSFKTMLIANNNITKHASDVAFETQWNVIASHFNGHLEELRDIAGRGANGIKVQTRDGERNLSDFLTDTIVYKEGDKISSKKMNMIMYDDSYAKDTVNALDKLIERMSGLHDERSMAVIRDLKALQQDNIAFVSFQRQQMTTFQGQNFKMDQRVYQGLVMQGEGNYVRSGNNGARLAEEIRSNIESGFYDTNESIARLSYAKSDGSIFTFSNAYTDAYANRVRAKRGYLQPKQQQEMLLGIDDTLEYMKGNFDIDQKNIIKVKANDILRNIPEGGIGREGYKDFIFKVDGELPLFMEHRRGNVLGNNLNSFYVDLSEFKGLRYEGSRITDTEGKAIVKDLKGLVLPFQNIVTSLDDDVYFGNAQTATLSFLNKLKDIDKIEDKAKNKYISEALDDLLDAYKKERNTSDKNSLITKSYFKMAMPSSSGAIARDAVVPTVDFGKLNLTEMRHKEFNILDAFESGTNLRVIRKSKDFEDLQEMYQQKKDALTNQISKINAAAQAKQDTVDLFKFTSGNELYKNYIRSYDANGNLIFDTVGNTTKQRLESAVIIGKEMLDAAEMNPGMMGYQLSVDYFRGGKMKLQAYDSFSRSTLKDFEISTEEINKALNNIFDAFENEKEFSSWSKVRRAINKVDTNLPLEEQYARKMRILNVNLSRQTNTLRRQGKLELLDTFQDTVNKQFESIGERYMKEVGILGLTNRYPNFSQFGTLPIRIYLGDIQGKAIRFLGPQFSVLQNVDFDGDNEFLKFIANGGLMPKQTTEYMLAQNQFDYMNKMNFDIFKESLEDSVKEYRLGDKTDFKAQLLKSLDEEKYSKAKEEFVKTFNSGDAKAFLDQEGKFTSLGELMFHHSRQIKEQFEKLDTDHGGTILLEDMIKASVQANVMKEFIGDFSKPNLEIRNAMTYMLSMVEDNSEAEKKLLQINSILSSLDKTNEFTTNTKKVGPGGILTMLEQKGIDTKHVKDASNIQNTNAWREGVVKLFEGAKGSRNPNQNPIGAMQKLVEGSRKVYFSKTASSDEAIAEEILKTSLDDYIAIAQKSTDDALNEVLGKAYLRGLYEMSTMENAYKGFFNTFRKAALADEMTYLRMAEQLPEEYFEAFEKGQRYDFSAIAEYSIHKHAIEHGTEEALMVNGRGINARDILAYDTEYGPKGYVVESIIDNDKGHTLRLKEYDFQTKTTIEDSSLKVQGITIKDLNENIKSGKIYDNNTHRYRSENIRVLDFKRDGINKNVNTHYLAQLDENATKSLMADVNQLFVANKLQDLFEADDTTFAKAFDNAIKSRGVINKYDNAHVGNLIGSIVGTDANVVKEKIDTINEYLEYGVRQGYISGDKSAKELITNINKQIAANPRQNINRFKGEGGELVTNYTQGIVDLRNNEANNWWITNGIESIKEKNDLHRTLDDAILEKNTNINAYADKFYGKVIQEPILEDSAYNEARAAFEQEIAKANDTVFNALRKTSDAEQAMFNSFGWDGLKNTDFILSSNNGKIESAGRAQIGYGRFIGTKLEDINEGMRQSILNTELTDDVLNSLKESGKDLEWKAATNTRILLNQYKGFSANSDFLDFTNADTLRTSYKALHAEDEFIKQQAAKEAREALERAAKVDSTKKKTLLNSASEVFSMSPEMKKGIKTGGLILAGASALGLVGHALFNRTSDNKDVEVPVSVERQTGNRIVSSKQGTEYSNAPTEAKQVRRMPKQAPASPKPKKHNTIYHDAGSGFNFKVSAQSYNKLQAESLHGLMQQVGGTNNSLNISRDNSRITDNWLENKFAELSE